MLLILGAAAALLWANIDPSGYRAFVDFPLLDHTWIGRPGPDGARALTVHFLVNDMAMALFFALAGKEVWEAIVLRNGSLRGRRAMTPLIATLGGMAGPVAVYLGIAALFGSTTFDAAANGWAIPTATDIAFSYLVGRAVFGAGHPAVRFLLLLAIADDAAGLLILAIFYPSEHLAPAWLLLSLGAALAVWLAANRLPRILDAGRSRNPASTMVRRRLGVWPYALAGCASWYGFHRSGMHPAPGLLPVVTIIPHADVNFGWYADAKSHLHDLLNTIEAALRAPVEGVLFCFGLVNAGVQLGAVGPATWLVLGGLLIGKPAGIFAFGWIAARPMGLGLPPGMSPRDLAVLGCAASIGFTVSLFIASVAFAPGPLQDAAKMGALFSFSAVAVSLVAGRMFGIVRSKG